MPSGHLEARPSLAPSLPSAGSIGLWRWLPAAVAGLVWLALLGLTLVPAWQLSARASFSWMLEPLFHDWQVVKLGLEASVAGIDPLQVKSLPFNYPRIVLLVAGMGRQVPTHLAGLITAAAFLAALVWVLWPRSRGQACLAAVLVGGLPVLLLVERGNLDAWAFVLVVLGLTAMTTQPESIGVTAAGSLAVLVAALLKLYPVMLLPAAALFWLGRRRGWCVAGFAIWVLWLVTSVDEVVLILQKTTRGLDLSYGRVIAATRYVFEVVAPGVSEHDAAVTFGRLMNVSLVACVAGFLLAGYAGWHWRERFAGFVTETRERVFFWSGALIYGGTFFLDSNWSYRLVFLGLCVPFLWRLSQVAVARPWGLAGLTGITLLFISPGSLPLGWFFAQQAVAWLLAWLLVGGAVALLAADKEAGR